MRKRMKRNTETIKGRNFGRLHRRAAGLGALAVASIVIGAPSVGSAQTTGTSDLAGTGPIILTFEGSAAAHGFRVTGTVPGAPATDDPIDSGGPSAKAALNSIGASTSYAAFPDPGVLVVTGPGLVAGLLAGGAFGLPPIELPASPPDYPFFVSSDANTPDQSVGAGPYRLEADSDSQASTASASAGFQPDVVGNVAFSTATASVMGSDQEVVSEATTDLQALTVGPLSIGQIKSKASMTLDSFGLVTSSSSLEIVGMRIGNLPVAFTPDGFVVGGSSQPVPVNDSLAQLLAPSKMSVEVVAAQEFKDRVVAPALRITMPFDFALSEGATVMTVTIGSATAVLSGASTQEGVSPEVGSPAEASAPKEASGPASDASNDGHSALPSFSDEGAAPPSYDTSLASPQPASVTDEALPAASSAAAPPPTSSSAASAVGSSAASTVGTATGNVQRFDVGVVYLGVVVAGIGTSAIGLFARRLGKRRIWAFLGG